MSDEPKDTQPTKLKLSRDLKGQDAADKDPAEKSPPPMKLKRKEPAEARPSEPATSPSTFPPPSTTDTPASTSANSGENKPGFDPTSPFGDAIKQGEIKTTESPPPPELPSKPAPRVDDGSGAKIEEAIHSIDQDIESSTKSHLLPSLITLFVLLLVLSAAGYGLWIVLKSPTDTEEAQTAKTDQTSNTTETTQAAKEIEPTTKGPIQKAKEAIAKVPVADVEAITGVEDPEETPAETITETPAEIPAKTLTEAPTRPLDESFDPQPTASTDAIEATKQNVSQYLSAIHIGGVRKGERPMILIDGQSFQVGDIIESTSGLKFDGLRKGKLAFRDSNGIIYLKSF